jgi:hypothetical protein
MFLGFAGGSEQEHCGPPLPPLLAAAKWNQRALENNWPECASEAGKVELIRANRELLCGTLAALLGTTSEVAEVRVVGPVLADASRDEPDLCLARGANNAVYDAAEVARKSGACAELELELDACGNQVGVRVSRRCMSVEAAVAHAAHRNELSASLNLGMYSIAVLSGTGGARVASIITLREPDRGLCAESAAEFEPAWARIVECLTNAAARGVVVVDAKRVNFCLRFCPLSGHSAVPVDPDSYGYARSISAVMIARLLPVHVVTMFLADTFKDELYRRVLGYSAGTYTIGHQEARSRAARAVNGPLVVALSVGLSTPLRALFDAAADEAPELRDVVFCLITDFLFYAFNRLSPKEGRHPHTRTLPVHLQLAERLRLAHGRVRAALKGPRLYKAVRGAGIRAGVCIAFSEAFFHLLFSLDTPVEPNSHASRLPTESSPVWHDALRFAQKTASARVLLASFDALIAAVTGQKAR